MHESTKPEGRPPRGLKGDIHRARLGATATAGELREFVGQLSGRSPQEMVGIVAGSGLIRATVLATVITFALMVASSVYGYLMKKNAPPVVAAPVAAPTAAAPAAPAQGTAAASATGAAAPATGAAAAAPNTPVPPTGPTGPVDPLSRLGVSEVKNSDPKKNPLENSGDDIFKDLKK